MLNLKTFFKNHFDNPQISDDELQKYSEDHLARMMANNPDGRLKDAIILTTEAHLAYYGAVNSEDVAAAIRQGMTMRVDNAITKFKKMVQQKEGAIRSAFGDDSPEYQEFFPQGMNEYNHANKENIERLMERMATIAANHTQALETDLPKTFAAMRDEFKPLREMQLGKKGEVDGKKSMTASNRTALEWQLMGNIHFIGFLFPNDPQKCMSYFDQSFLRDAVRGDHGENDEQTDETVA